MVIKDPFWCRCGALIKATNCSEHENTHKKKTLVIKPDFGQVSLIYFSDSAIKTQLNILEPLNLETKMIFIDVFPIKTSIYR